MRKSSTGEDRQAQSLEGQYADNSKVIEREGLQVVDEFEESRSASIPNNRPEFRKMIDRISKGHASGIVCWNIDRLSRNPIEGGEIQWLLQKGILKSIWTPYREYRSEDNALLLGVETSSATQYTRDLSEKVKRGLKQKIAAGHPPGSAPLGYLNTKSSIRGSNTIIKDPERWHLMRKAYDMLLAGTHTVPMILDTLNKAYGFRTRPGSVRGGKPMGLSTLYRIFCDPFYYGYFLRKGVLYKGAYEPLITVEEYDQVQTILGRKGKPRPKTHIFPFTGLIKCGICGSSITACEKIKLIKSAGVKKTYVFYHCTKRKKLAVGKCNQKKYLPGPLLETMIVDELNKYEIRPAYKEWGLAILKENHEQEIAKRQKLVDTQIKLESKIQKELDNLVSLRLSDGISEEKYFDLKADKETALIPIQSKKRSLEQRARNWISEVEQKLNFTVNVVDRFRNGNLETKKTICHQFGWNWVLKDQKLFIDKHRWLEPIKNYKEAVENAFGRLEPEKTFAQKGQNTSFEVLRPILRERRESNPQPPA